jgi:hypothetical protein
MFAVSTITRTGKRNYETLMAYYFTFNYQVLRISVADGGSVSCWIWAFLFGSERLGPDPVKSCKICKQLA